MHLARYAVGLLFILLGFWGPILANETVKLSDSQSKIESYGWDETGVSLRIEIGAIEFIPVKTPNGEYIIPRIDGFVKSNNIGLPGLPTANRLISIPYGCELRTTVEDYIVEEMDLADYGISLPVMPAQPSLSKSQKPEDVPFEYNDAIYESDIFYTQPLAQSEIMGIMRSDRIALISASLLEYNPVRNRLRVYREISIRVEFINPDWQLTRSKYKQYHSPYFESAFEIVEDFNSLKSSDDNLTHYPIKYVIVADRMFESQLQPFIAWKTKKGFIVEVFYTDEIGYANTEIRDHLDSMYQASTPSDPAPTFVLFAGDAEQIPPFEGTADNHVTDLRFCEFTGDDFPEMFYGRFSAQSPAELQPQIDKTLEYEQYLMPSPDYLEEVVLIAGVDASNALSYGNGQVNYGTTYYFNSSHGIDANAWLYPASAASGTNSAIISQINDGLSFANYTGHCNHSNWSNPYISTSHINDFTNYHKYLLGIGNCCQSNTFTQSTPCFGEAWMQQENAGGIGYIGATNDTYWDEDYYWAVGYGPIIGSGATYEQTGLGAYDRLFHDHGEPVEDHYVPNGAIVYAGNLSVSQSNSSRKAYYWEIYMLMGDPSLMTYLGVPEVNNIDHPHALPMDETSIIVAADEMSYVAISIGDQLYGAGYVDESKSVSLDLNAFEQPCTADIVITGQNKEPYISTIEIVTPVGPYVSYSGYSIDDLSGGNGDSQPDCGENILLGVELTNIGLTEASGVQATLSCEDPFVIIEDNSEGYGHIAGDNESLMIADAFSLSIAPDIPDGRILDFEIVIEANQGYLWSDNFSIACHAPVLEFLSLTINDETGNGNGILDPGETVEAVVTLANSGSGAADDVTALLNESDAYIIVDDNFGSFGALAASGGTGDNALDPFIISADISCPRGYVVDCSLNLAAASGYVTDLNLDIIVGDRAVFHVDDFSYDRGWSGLGGEGEWMIGPAVGGAGIDIYGGPDPAIDNSPGSDNGVLGNDLNPGSGGDYNISLDSPRWVTSPPIDCSEYYGVTLSFYRWLGVENFYHDHAVLEVYDGANWMTLFENMEEIDEPDWSEQIFDVSSAADSNEAFRIRFGIGSTDASRNYCGWNIDDLTLKGYGEWHSARIAFDTENVWDSLIEDDIAESVMRIYNFSSEIDLQVKFTPDAGWLSCSQEVLNINPSDSLDLELTFDASQLQPGDYTGHLAFACNDYSRQYDTIAVYLHIFAPAIEISTSSMVDTLEYGGSSTQELTINNTGPGLLIFTAECGQPALDMLFSTNLAEKFDVGSWNKSAQWLSVTPLSDTVDPFSATTLSIGFEADGIDPGYYQGEVLILSNDVETPFISIAVSLTVEEYLCGDANGDYLVDVADAVYIINFVFKGGAAPDPIAAADANLDEFVNIADAVYLLRYIFSGGNEPCFR